MAVIYIVAKGGGQWRLYVKDTGPGHRRYTPGSKKQAVKDARERAKKSVKSSAPPNSALLIELAADREVRESQVYGKTGRVDARIARDQITSGPYGTPVEVTFKYGPGGESTTFQLASYMTKTEAGENVRRLKS